MANPPDPQTALTELDAATRQYEADRLAFETSRQRTVDTVVAALKAGALPSEVARRSPFTDTYVRRLAREAGIPPSPPGMKPGRRQRPQPEP
jgi:hypothetical protein